MCRGQGQPSRCARFAVDALSHGVSSCLCACYQQRERWNATRTSCSISIWRRLLQWPLSASRRRVGALGRTAVPDKRRYGPAKRHLRSTGCAWACAGKRRRVWWGGRPPSGRSWIRPSPTQAGPWRAASIAMARPMRRAAVITPASVFFSCLICLHHASKASCGPCVASDSCHSRPAGKRL